MSDSSYMFGQWAADDDGEASESARAEYEQQARIEEERQSDSSLREALERVLEDHELSYRLDPALGVVDPSPRCDCGWMPDSWESEDEFIEYYRDHRTDAVLAVLAGCLGDGVRDPQVAEPSPCLGDGVCTNPKCPVHGIKEAPSDQPN
jgi:hypothetical protein